jgi:hypothetical protein
MKSEESGTSPAFPATRPLRVEDLAERALREPLDARQLKQAQVMKRRQREGHRLLEDHVDPCRLDQAGWGVIFPEETNHEIVAALDPLLKWREGQVAAARAGSFRVLTGQQGYRSGQSRFDFLNAQGASHDVVDTSRLPYYLLLVGSPEEIPFSFQYQLDLQHAVGRLDLETTADYYTYAKSLVAAEQTWSARLNPRRAVVFCPTDDAVGQRILRQLVDPLLQRFQEKPIPGWKIEAVVGTEASRERLLALLSGSDQADFLLTAGHGLRPDLGAPGQREDQGGLCCHDGAVFASDLPLAELGCPIIAMNFACFGAGTEAWDEFDLDSSGHATTRLAARPFTARLPQRLLASPRAGSAAILGHIGRAWTTSFSRLVEPWGEEGPILLRSQIEPFVMAMRRLLRGCPAGHALEPFNLRSAEMATELAYHQNLKSCGGVTPPGELATILCQYLDARNFVVLGDPAARLLPEALPEKAS